MDLYRKIDNLTEEDYSNTFDISRILDYMNARANEAMQKWNLAELKLINGAIHKWLYSINKWKERYRHLMIKLSRVEHDLESLSLRISRMNRNVDKQMRDHKRVLDEKDSDKK